MNAIYAFAAVVVLAFAIAKMTTKSGTGSSSNNSSSNNNNNNPEA